MALKTKPRNQLDRVAWIDAAIDVLGEAGLDGVRIEVLAKRCRVTKGSFYWHFKDRNELLGAILNVWKESRIEDVRKHTRVDDGKVRAQICRLLEIYGGSTNRRGMTIELAVRDWARRDSQAAMVVAEVDEARLQYTQNLFVAAGLPRREAASRSLLVYTYTFGLSLMNFERSKIEPLKEWIAEYIVGEG
ncbi:MAG: TetR/AcrR family transcriptional regulator [Gammaproteobacteria bacterium]|nr:TetR/AcrR family transcriptional regulator [Gammaproteobacteria bacterium]